MNMNLLQQGLDVQQLQVNANRLTDADVANIKGAGLRLVCRPDPVNTNVVSLDDRRVMQAHTSPEAA
jgi:hypothetical protein